ncbi:hypothetical protein IG631_07416 [Alternaria alternata]|jgi:hypothetical protein|nr:hypothetical protein IG631_07416 [Alternaria alternata]
MIVAVWVEVGDAIYVVDGREHALLALSAYLSPRRRGSLDGRRGIWGYGCTSSTGKGQLCTTSTALVLIPRDAGPRFPERAILVKRFIAKLRLEQIDPRGFARSRRVELCVPVVSSRVIRRRLGHYEERCVRMSRMCSGKEDSVRCGQASL